MTGQDDPQKYRHRERSERCHATTSGGRAAVMKMWNRTSSPPPLQLLINKWESYPEQKGKTMRWLASWTTPENTKYQRSCPSGRPTRRALVETEDKRGNYCSVVVGWWDHDGFVRAQFGRRVSPVEALALIKDHGEV